jgi:hypothetical protein
MKKIATKTPRHQENLSMGKINKNDFCFFPCFYDSPWCLGALVAKILTV